jgi:hypothetical protein
MWIFSLIFIFLTTIFSVAVNLKNVPEKIRSYKSYFEYFYLFLIIVLVGYSTYLTYGQFFLWKNSDPGKYLLPPYTPVIYFITYAFYKFWSHFLAALIFSLIILLLAVYFNKKRGGIHFYEEEPYYIAIAILAVGYPGWLVYFGLILVAPFLFSIFYFLFSKKTARISYYYLWLALAFFSILISRWLSTFWWWGKLII